MANEPSHGYEMVNPTMARYKRGHCFELGFFTVAYGCDRRPTSVKPARAKFSSMICPTPQEVLCKAEDRFLLRARNNRSYWFAPPVPYPPAIGSLMSPASKRPPVKRWNTCRSKRICGRRSSRKPHPEVSTQGEPTPLQLLQLTIPLQPQIQMHSGPATVRQTEASFESLVFRALLLGDNSDARYWMNFHPPRVI